MDPLAKKVAATYKKRVAREGEIASNPAIEALGAHLGDGDEPDKHVEGLSPAGERFDSKKPAQENPFAHAPEEEEAPVKAPPEKPKAEPF